MSEHYYSEPRSTGCVQVVATTIGVFAGILLCLVFVMETAEHGKRLREDREKRSTPTLPSNRNTLNEFPSK